MPKIIQHRPAYVTGYENQTVEFNTVEELLNIPFVKAFSELPEFHRYSTSKPWDKTRRVLMAEYKDGYEWWVIGYIDDENSVKELPEWNAKYKVNV